MRTPPCFGYLRMGASMSQEQDGLRSHWVKTVSEVKKLLPSNAFGNSAETLVSNAKRLSNILPFESFVTKILRERWLLRFQAILVQIVMRVERIWWT